MGTTWHGHSRDPLHDENHEEDEKEVSERIGVGIIQNEVVARSMDLLNAQESLRAEPSLKERKSDHSNPLPTKCNVSMGSGFERGDFISCLVRPAF